MFFNHKGIKTAKRDFTNADLSPNRKKQFFGILHDEWKLLLLLSFFFLLLFAPYLSVSFYSQYRLLMGMESDALSFSLAMETVKSLCLLAFLTPVYVLTFSGFAISKFDLYLNAEFYPSLYRKGLRKEENKEGKSEK